MRCKLPAVSMVLVSIPGVMAVNIETVRVGNPGNVADTEVMVTDGTTGYGSVGYTYNIGKHEVTAGQYTEFLNKVAGVDAYGLYNTNMWTSSSGCKIERYAGSGTDVDPYQYRVAVDWAHRPVNYVSWGDSARFANWLHNGQPTGAQDLTTTEDGTYYLDGATSDAALLAVNRESDWKWAITSENEWYKAAYYNPATGSYYDYSTSSNSVPSNDLINPDPGNNANFYQSGYTIGSPYFRTEIGEFENSDSPYGTFDQSGNVWEWNEAVLLGFYRGLRGGSFIVIDDSALHASYRYEINPTNEGSDVGFRVSEVPEPTPLSFLTLGALALLRRRRQLNPSRHC